MRATRLATQYELHIFELHNMRDVWICPQDLEQVLRLISKIPIFGTLTGQF